MIKQIFASTSRVLTFLKIGTSLKNKQKMKSNFNTPVSSRVTTLWIEDAQTYTCDDVNGDIVRCVLFMCL